MKNDNITISDNENFMGNMVMASTFTGTPLRPSNQKVLFSSNFLFLFFFIMKHFYSNIIYVS